MRNVTTLLLASMLLVVTCAPRAFGGSKPLPPAFGKELVPDSKTEERNETKAGEIEEQQGEQEVGRARGGGRPAPHGRIHIQLDGDEDGDDGEDSGDDL